MAAEPSPTSLQTNPSQAAPLPTEPLSNDPPPIPRAADPLAFRRILAGVLLGAALTSVLFSFPYQDVAAAPSPEIWEPYSRVPALFFSSFALGSTAVALAMLQSPERWPRAAPRARPETPPWSELERLFALRERFFRRFREEPAGPQAPEEWAEAGACLALFEQCEMLIRLGLIDDRRFRRVYTARLRDFVGSSAIRDRLLGEALPYEHPDFVALCRRCDVPWRESPFRKARASSHEENPSR